MTRALLISSFVTRRLSVESAREKSDEEEEEKDDDLNDKGNAMAKAVTHNQTLYRRRQTARITKYTNYRIMYKIQKVRYTARIVGVRKHNEL